MRIPNAILVIFILGFNIVRFLGLEESPPGFYVDETSAAINAMCMAEEGTDYAGNSLPLYALMETAGVVNAPYIYTGALWVKLFGHSIQSFRALSGFFTFLTILGIAVIAGSLLSNEAAVMVALVASVSPWAFQFSRIAWDPPLAPAFLVWGVFFFVCRKGGVSAVAAGVCFALAAYAYQATRVQMPLLIVLLCPLVVLRGTRSWKGCGLLFSSLVISLLPLAYAMMAPSLQSRFHSVGIFSATYMQSIGRQGTIFDLLVVFLENFLKHFSWKYLFVSGDANLRHSSQSIGEFSPLDCAALILGSGLLAEWLAVKRWQVWKSDSSFVISVGVLGFLAGIVPPAMTWESLPHALRSIGSWPFLALITGTILSICIARWRWGSVPLLILVASYALYFERQYFERYPLISREWFDASVVEGARSAIASGDWREFKLRYPGYPASAARYFLMHYRGDTCSGSRKSFAP